ncbi:hypothetical protein [Prolixibacter sp. SD074]|jgi:hypothetical protein|uniref:hypothetical protein n=1 Tax=Prolixibacter sp. SD074 TaxID=2652391 RepID=UPI00126B39A3|nr:hypothetical protein [Prolixibacter sp. SD074]GET30974.1 hypothetical protein SD074_31760 [Prolixibacter sp. SD074]
MEYLLDNRQIENTYQEIIRRIWPIKNGAVAEMMTKRGLEYKVNLGASIVSLRLLAENYSKNHLLALKLWNKQWRETMILATMLDEPSQVTEEQIDYWVKSLPTIEMAEQASMNLFVFTPFAFQKAREWCLEKKNLVKMTGLLMMGRLALMDKTTGDEAFESFFEVLPPLSKDPELSSIFIRSFTHIGRRNISLNKLAIMFARTLQTIGSPVSQMVAGEIIEELESDYIREMLDEKA